MKSDAQFPFHPFSVFLAYARVDESHLDKLREHLAPLRRERLISDWFDGKIIAGQEWEASILQRLDEARIILLLISSSFMNSDYCYGKEMTRALQRHEGREARVIPIIVSDVDWKSAPFAKLQVLPTGAKPVTRWRSRDAAWTDVA